MSMHWYMPYCGSTLVFPPQKQYPILRERQWFWQLCKQGEHNIALRVSEAEGLDTPRNMAGKAKWIWVDCFSKIPVGKK